jgi:hypothetical protein
MLLVALQSARDKRTVNIYVLACHSHCLRAYGITDYATLFTGLDTADVYYPTYFKGTWECKSITKEVEAPVGIELFGGNRYEY